MKSLLISDFLNLAKQIPVIDSRSPSEFLKGHFTNSYNICLLTDEHRQIIGTIYKNEGKKAAVLEGFRLVGPRFHEIGEQMLNLAEDNKIGIYCWRGGMRSEIMAWIAGLCGIEVFVLKGGYKHFRRHVLQTLNKEPKNIIVLSGNTGSGKTEILNILAGKAWPVIDLEKLAAHKGSSFGALGMPPQTQEMFENELAMNVYDLDSSPYFIVEDESRMIGTKCIPLELHEAMRSAQIIEVLVPNDIRIKRLVHEYSGFGKELLAEGTKRIEKRLGSQRTKAALDFLENGDFESWVSVLLEYYDKAYLHGRSKKTNDIVQIPFDWQRIDTSISDIEKVLKQLTK